MKSTFNTKIPFSKPSLPLTAITEYLNEYSDYFGRIERCLFVELVHRKTSLAKIKTTYLERFNITARQFNAISSNLKGKIDSVKELKKSELLKKRFKVKCLTEALSQKYKEKELTFDKLQKLSQNEKSFKSTVSKYRYLKRKIHGLKRAIQECNYKIDVMEKDSKNKIVRICFGSKSFFKKQHNLMENNFKTHSEWLQKWKEKINSFYLEALMRHSEIKVVNIFMITRWLLR